MTLAELIQEVYTITGRPDRVAETLSAIKAATLKMHQSDFYPDDLFESGLVFDTESYVQNYEYRTTLPRYRAMKYLRKFDNVSGLPGKFLTAISPEQVLDEYGCQKQDIFYLAGAYLQINSSTTGRYYLIGCYLNPDITQVGYNSWIALDHPYAIIYEAAAMVFKAIGKDEEASMYRGLVLEQIQNLRSSKLVVVGF